MLTGAIPDVEILNLENWGGGVWEVSGSVSVAKRCKILVLGEHLYRLATVHVVRHD